jgi:hypothetical protein
MAYKKYKILHLPTGTLFYRLKSDAGDYYSTLDRLYTEFEIESDAFPISAEPQRLTFIFSKTSAKRFLTHWCKKFNPNRARAATMSFGKERCEEYTYLIREHCMLIEVDEHGL